MRYEKFQSRQVFTKRTNSAGNSGSTSSMPHLELLLSLWRCGHVNIVSSVVRGSFLRLSRLDRCNVRCASGTGRDLQAACR